ncbi:MAG: protein phosphatase 2C domain-containing protein [Planctomycetes bacterium]|nr:protein phosphatase 2C domain-containing protein [Planctomycetota bacterium]
MRTRISFHGRTDVGRRRELNEDTFYSSDKDGFAVVADGMGGRDFGEVASSLFVSCLNANMKKYFPECMRERSLDDPGGAAFHLVALFDLWFRDINETVYNWGDLDRKYREMGTTVAVLYQQADFVITGHVGDSRIYRFRDGRVALITEDHSFINTQLKAKLITPEEALRSTHKNIITRAVGTRATVKPTIQVKPARPDDIYLLCSDGLSDLVSEESMREILSTRTSLEEATDALVNEANERGGKDNITVVLGKVLPADGAAP